MKGIILGILIIFSFCLSGKAETVEVKFSACVDGDTATFKLEKEKIKVRFLAIDTPESVHPKKEEEAFGKISSDYTCNLLKNAEVIKLEYDEHSDKLDKYNRHLAWIWIDNVLLQQLLIKQGYAEVAYIYGDYKYTMDLCKEQEGAYDKKIGIWSLSRTPNYCNTIEYTEGTILDTETVDVIFENQGNEDVIPVLKNSVVKKIDDPIKKGYIFKGWYLNDKKFDFAKPVTEKIVLEARYEIDFYYVIVLAGLIIISVCSKKITKSMKRKKNG